MGKSEKRSGKNKATSGASRKIDQDERGHVSKNDGEGKTA